VAGWLVRERRSLDILPVKKEAKLSASEVPGEVVGSGEEDLRCRSLLTVCQRRLGLSQAEDMRLGKYSFLEDRMSLWYWLRRDLNEDQSAAVRVRFQMFSAWRRVDQNARRVVENHGFDGDWRLESLLTMGASLSSREDRVVL